MIELEYVRWVLFSDTLASFSKLCMGRNCSENEIQAAVRVNQKNGSGSGSTQVLIDCLECAITGLAS